MLEELWTEVCNIVLLIAGLGEKASEGETGMIREFKEAEILCSSRKQNKYILSE